MAERQPHLFLDCDGVLADFDKGAIAVLGLPPRAFEKRHGIGRLWQKLAQAPELDQVLQVVAQGQRISVQAGLHRVGAAAGRELADDKSDGRQNTATVAGAVAGAVAGNAIQNANQRKYNVQVRMDNGRSTTVTMNNVNSLQVGSAVRVANGQVIAR